MKFPLEPTVIPRECAGIPNPLPSLTIEECHTFIKEHLDLDDLNLANKFPCLRFFFEHLPPEFRLSVKIVPGYLTSESSTFVCALLEQFVPLGKTIPENRPIWAREFAENIRHDDKTSGALNLIVEVVIARAVVAAHLKLHRDFFQL